MVIQCHNICLITTFNKLQCTINGFVKWLLTIPLDSDIGYIFEVDWEYTDQCKKLTKRLPLAPEKKKVDIHYFSSEQIKIITEKIIKTLE